LKDSKAKLIGIEPNDMAVSFAQKHYGKFAEFKVGDALNIPLKDSSGDVAIFFDVIEHVPSGTEKQALKEINRILKKGGTLLLSTPNSHLLTNLFDPAWYFGHRHYQFTKLEKIVEECGFKVQSHVVRGGIISVFYMFWFYTMKWIFQVKNPRSRLLEKMEDNAYNSDNGIFTHYLVAKAK
jgi:ubiquinone/menaquinone biosynthesis C-methylase UbiE